jgi:uncharacterized membrane protein
MPKKLTALLMVAVPVLTGYAVQYARGETAIKPLDAYLVFYAFSLTFVLLVLGQKAGYRSVRENLRWSAGLDRISGHALKLICFVSALFFFLWTLVLWWKFYSFRLDFVDSGIYSEIVYNFAQSQNFYSSFYKIHSLGEHFSPIVVVFAPFFWINPSVLWLLTAQTAAFAVCPILLFYICRKLIKGEALSRKIALGAAVLWFAFPTLLNAVQTGFHPSTLSPPFILLGFYFLVANRMWPFWAIMVFLLLFKENLSLVWISFGLYSLLVLKRKSLGMTLILVGGLGGVAVVKWVIPFFRGGDWGHVGRIGPLEHIYDKLKYLWLYLFVPLGFLSLTHWRSSVMIWPPILLNLSVSYTKQLHGVYHYDDIIVPVLFLAAISALASEKYRPVIRKVKLLNARFLLCWFIVPLTFALIYPVERLIAYYPNETHASIAQELQKVKARWPETTIHVQHNLRMVLNRYENIKSLHRDWRAGEFDSGDVIVLAPDLKHIKSNKYYNLKKDYASVLKYFEANSGDKFKRVSGPFQYLVIYEAL